MQQQTELLDTMGDEGESMPGLDEGPIIDNLAKESDELKAANASIDDEAEEDAERAKRDEKKEMTDEEKKAERKKKKAESKKKADEKKKKMKDSFKAAAKVMVKEKMTIIKQNYKLFKDSVESIPPDVTALIANLALPPSISAPPSAPNPLYALNVALQAKHSLSIILNNAIIAFTEILKAANAIKYQIPAPILLLFNQILSAKDLISSIPG